MTFPFDAWPKTRPVRLTGERGLRCCRLSRRCWTSFLRAETMHGFFTYLELNPGRNNTAFHDMSHGESFLELAVDRFRGPGLGVLDEPESALSFAGCLSLLSVLKRLLAEVDRRSSCPHTHPCWQRCRARRYWKWVPGGCAGGSGLSWNWCPAGRHSWTVPRDSCATYKV